MRVEGVARVAPQVAAVEEDDDDFGYAAKRGGTEVYTGSDDEDDDDELISEPSSISAASKPTTHARPSRPSKPPRATPVRPKTELGKLAGMELTSIINIIDLEAQGTNVGAFFKHGWELLVSDIGNAMREFGVWAILLLPVYLSARRWALANRHDTPAGSA